MHGGRMPAQVYRVNAVRAGVVEWTAYCCSGWSGRKDVHHGGSGEDHSGPRNRRGPPHGVMADVGFALWC
jgi:hypothetical protein